MRESQYAITTKDKDGQDRLTIVASGTPDDGQIQAEAQAQETPGQTYTLWQAVGEVTAKVTFKREPYRRKGWDMLETPGTEPEAGTEGGQA